MRDVDDGERQPLLQLADLLAHLPAQPRVEVRQRLVEQQHRGSSTSARATATRCCWPPESSRGQARRRGRRGRRSRAPRARARRASRLRHARRRRARSATFSSTRHVREQRVALEHHRHVALGGRHARSRRRRRSGSCPRVGSSRPAIRRSVVVLPQPEGPSSVTSVPARDGERDVAHGGDVAVALADVAEFDRGGFHRRVRLVPVTRRCRRRAPTPAARRPPRAGRAGARRRAAGSARSPPASARSAPSSRRSRRRSRR